VNLLPNTGRMKVIQLDLNWCIPAGLEWMLQFLDINPPVLNFQEEINKRTGGNNSFASCLQALKDLAPSIGQQFLTQNFVQGNGQDKLNYVEQCITHQKPCLISVNLLEGSLQPSRNYHIVPVIGIDSQTVLVSNWNGVPTPVTPLSRHYLIDIHDSYPGGDDVLTI